VSPTCVGRAPAALPTTYTGPATHTDTLVRTNLGLDGAGTQTCDRTIAGSQDAFYRLPLVESPTQVEGAMAADPSYECTVTWDNGGTKTGLLTPTQGCCGTAVQMQTGAGGAASAHLEPVSSATAPTTCAIPAY
jgi:hypothetical protein